MQEKYGFVYIWYDRKRKMYYIGSHWGTEDDGYICSSNRMRNVYKRRPHDFSRKVIKRVYTDRKTLLEQEEKWLKKAEHKKEKYYNINFSCTHHWLSDEKSRLSVSEKISNALKGHVQSEETKAKRSAKLKGRKRDPEIGRKISEAKRKAFQMKREKGLSCFEGKAAENLIKARQKMKGTTLSEEQKEVLRQRTLEKWQDPEYAEKVSAGLKKSHANMDEETKKVRSEKISMARKRHGGTRTGQKNSPEHNEKIRIANTGKKLSKEA